MVIKGTASYSRTNTKTKWEFWDGTKRKTASSQTCCVQDWYTTCLRWSQQLTLKDRGMNKNGRKYHPVPENVC